jgi:hypothetical protein
MPGKQEILNEIKRTAAINNNHPLGEKKFENETGIKPHEWSKYWARFGDAQRDAGFQANLLQGAYPDAVLIDKVIGLTRKLGRFPTQREMKVERNNNDAFPSAIIFFRRFGSKQGLLKKIVEHCKQNKDCKDILNVVELLVTGDSDKHSDDSDLSGQSIVGSVYLYEHGNKREWKIGRSNDTVRRGQELRIQMPDELKLVHEIKTDDPSGVEAYWHNRFGSKRKNGEWFDLKSADIKAFKRWKRIA